MTKSEIELAVIEAADLARNKQKKEDWFVEKKSAWFDINNDTESLKWARRIAGHANAAQGQPILWIVGIDDGEGVVGKADSVDPAVWSAKLIRHFDGEHPSFRDQVVKLDTGEIIVAIAIDTDRPPYVISYTDNGTKRFEVPWREGTAPRHARRSELLKMLVPATRLPTIETLNASITFRYDRHRPEYNPILNVIMYVVPAKDTVAVFPVKGMTAKFELLDSRGVQRTIEFENVRPKTGTQLSLGVQATDYEVSVQNCGAVHLVAWTDKRTDQPHIYQEIRAELAMSAIGTVQQSKMVFVSEKAACRPINNAGARELDFEWILTGKGFP